MGQKRESALILIEYGYLLRLDNMFNSFGCGTNRPSDRMIIDGIIDGYEFQ